MLRRRNPRMTGVFDMTRGILAAVLVLASGSAMAEYTFDVHNNSDQAIVTIEVSEDGETWREFDIGDGIASEATETLVWDASTDEGNCEWEFRATFEEGFVTPASAVDFCQEDITISFDL